MIAELIEDLTNTVASLPPDSPHSPRLLGLLSSLRRQSRFVQRAPTGLFQSLWNEFSPGPADESAEDLGAGEAELRTAALNWRAEKERITPGFRCLFRLSPPSGELPELSLPLHGSAVSGIDLHPDGSKLLSSDKEGRLTLTDLANGRTLWLLDFGAPVKRARFAPDGRRICALVWKSLRYPTEPVIVDGISGMPVKHFDPRRANLTDVAWDQSGSQLVLCGFEREVPHCILLDATTGRELQKQKTAGAWQAAALPSGSVVIGVPTTLYTSKDFKLLNRSRVFHGAIISNGLISDLEFSTDAESEKWISARMARGVVAAVVQRRNNPRHTELIGVDLETKQTLFRFPCPEVLADCDIQKCDVSRDHARLLLAVGNLLIVFDTSTGEMLGNFAGHSSRVSDCVLLPDGKQILSADDSGWIHVWQPRFATAISISELLGDRRIRDCDFAPDGKRYVAVSESELRIWDDPAHACVHRHPIDHATCCRIAPEGDLVLVGLRRKGGLSTPCAHLIPLDGSASVRVLRRSRLPWGSKLIARAFPLTFAVLSLVIMVWINTWLLEQLAATGASTPNELPYGARLIYLLFALLAFSLFFVAPVLVWRWILVETTVCRLFQNGSKVALGESRQLVRFWRRHGAQFVREHELVVGGWRQQWNAAARRRWWTKGQTGKRTVQDRKDARRAGGIEGICDLEMEDRILVSARSTGIQVLDLRSGKVLQQLAPPGPHFQACDYNSTLRTAAGLVEGNRVRLWHMSGDEHSPRFTAVPHEALAQCEGDLDGICFSPSGGLLAGFSTGGTLLIWETETLALTSALQVAAGITCIAWDPDGTQLIVGDAAGNLTAYERV